MTFTDTDARHMARALELARRGLYTTDPNPRVGCVVVKDGKIVGEGFHARAGEPHAEINAVRAAGAAACGATVYLTLEPCCHHGKTPPCTQALIAAGVARVVAAMQDPNPRVAGQGFAELKQAGIGAAYGLMQSEAEVLNPGFISRMQRGRPFVRVKLAASLDGRTAMANGESKMDHGRARARGRAALARAILGRPHRHRHRAGRRPVAQRARLRCGSATVARGVGQSIADVTQGQDAGLAGCDAGGDRQP